MKNSKKAVIFDLDGVIVDTAKFHFLAWQNLAEKLGITFTAEDNEHLKGVSRVRSLEKILKWGHKEVSQEEFEELMHDKNEEYLTYVNQMTTKDILPRVKETLDYLKKENHPIALGSASKNAKRILKHVGLMHYFDAIVDGNEVTQAKPNPEVFLKAAKLLNVNPQNAIVFEDSLSGIEAANTGQMLSIGIGNARVLAAADYVFKNFRELDLETLKNILNKQTNL
ncbi:MAG: beta-phosphoglucomutase [Flavobacteriaceae bacterium]|nr:beta-phosphoglucomutase [Psychroflexus sp.]